MTPEQQADDVHRLLSALGAQPAYVFGSSGGAVVGLALVTAHPDQVRTLVAHEPPVVELLPDSAQVRDQIEDIYHTYRPWHWPTSSEPPWSTFPVTTADSWPCRSSAPASWTRCDRNELRRRRRCKDQPQTARRATEQPTSGPHESDPATAMW